MLILGEIMYKLKQLLGMITTDESKLFVNALAYSILVGIAPFIIIAVAFFGTYIVDVSVLVNLISRYVPSDLVLPFVAYLSASQINNLGIVISLLTASLWVGSKSVYSFMLLNNQYQVAKQTGFLLRIVSLLYFIIIIAFLGLMIFAAVLVGIGSPLIIVPILIVFLMLFYKMTSSRKDTLIQVMPGSFVSSLLLIGFGQIFFIYVNNFSNYSSIYGPLASIVVLMISAWFISWILFFGYSLNYVIKTEGEKELEKI